MGRGLPLAGLHMKGARRGAVFTGSSRPQYQSIGIKRHVDTITDLLVFPVFPKLLVGSGFSLWLPLCLPPVSHMERQNRDGN